MAASDSLLEKYRGDLDELVGKFDSSGLGEKIRSWIGTGPNDSINAEEIKNTLGSELDELAAKIGLARDEAADELARDLPSAVDEATPMGTVDDRTTIAPS